MKKGIFTPKANRSNSKDKVIFVYGSLKSGHSNYSRILKMKGRSLGEAETEEGFELYFYEPYKTKGIATMIRSHSGTVVGAPFVAPSHCNH